MHRILSKSARRPSPSIQHYGSRSVLSATLAELPKILTAWLFGFMIWNSFGLSFWHLAGWGLTENGLWIEGLSFFAQPVLWLLLILTLMLSFGMAMRLQIARREFRYMAWAFLVYIAANGLLIALLIGLKSWLLAVFGLNAPGFLFDLTLPSWLWVANQLLPCMFTIITFASLLPRIRRRATNAVTQGDVVEIETLQ